MDTNNDVVIAGCREMVDVEEAIGGINCDGKKIKKEKINFKNP